MIGLSAQGFTTCPKATPKATAAIAMPSSTRQEPVLISSVHSTAHLLAVVRRDEPVPMVAEAGTRGVHSRRLVAR